MSPRCICETKELFRTLIDTITCHDIDIVLEELCLDDCDVYQVSANFCNNAIKQSILESYVSFIRHRLRCMAAQVIDVLQERHQPLYHFESNPKVVGAIRRYIAGKIFN